jgi:hypothetical protein
MSQPPWWRRPILLAPIVIAGLVIAGYATVWQPRAAKLREIQGVRGDIAWYEESIQKRSASVARLNQQARGMLGKTPDLADARFRTALNTLADAAGLEAIRVTSREPKAQTNPVGDAKLNGTLDSLLKRQIDFYTIEGELVGVGSLEQVLRTIATIQAQPWAHRLTALALRPEGDKERTRFELRLSVATIFAPDLVPKDAPEPARGLPDQEAETILAGITKKNVFRERAARVVAAPEAASPEAVAARDPYADWRLTAVVRSGDRQEAWLVNRQTGQRLTLGAGGQVENAVLVSAEGEAAVFTLDGKRYEVRMGLGLDSRRVIE